MLKRNGPNGDPDPTDRVLQPGTFSNRVSTLHEIALQIDAARGQEEILRVLRNETKWIISFDAAFLCLLDRFRTRYAVHALSALADTIGIGDREFPVADGVPGFVMQNQSPVFSDLTAPGPQPDSVEALLSQAGMQSLLVVPMRTGDETIGVMGFGSAQGFAYHEQEMVIAQLLATQVAIALQSTALFEDAQKRISQIELVNELAERLTSTLELDQLLSSAAENIRKTFHYFDVTIFLVNRADDEAVLVAHSGNYTDFLPLGYRQKLSDGLVGWVVMHDERALVNNIAEDPRYMTYAYHNTRSELVIPIRIEREIVGVLNIEDTRLHAFDETDAIVLETLCDQLGSAIHNAKLYDQLKKTNAKLTELDRMKSDFLGIVSHDFRSPLASIVLAGKSLLRRVDSIDPRRLQDYLTVIVEQANRLIRLAEDTLSITRMESGQLSYFFNVVNVERLIKDAASVVSFSTRHTLEYDVDPEMGYIKGDQTKLRQVLQNLLSNAVKYSPKGGLISVRARGFSVDQIVIAIHDEGIGIPTDQMGRLFQKFSRIDTAEAREIKGSGLGLWICKEIVKAHGGQIWAESEPDQGTTFSFTLKKAHPEGTV